MTRKLLKKNHTIQKKHIMRSIKRNASVSPLTENRSYPGAHVIDIWFLSVSVIKLLVWKKKKDTKKTFCQKYSEFKKIFFFFPIYHFYQYLHAWRVLIQLYTLFSTSLNISNMTLSHEDLLGQLGFLKPKLLKYILVSTVKKLNTEENKQLPLHYFPLYTSWIPETTFLSLSILYLQVKW